MNKKVLVLQGDSYKAVGEMFTAHGYDVLYDTEKLSQADLVVFTGGSDVSPYIYGEEPFGARGCDPFRDDFERDIYYNCVDFCIPMVGICRGGQLLNVLNGGKMIQHLGETISGDVTMECYQMVEDSSDYDRYRPMRVDHHQGMLARDDGAEVLAWLPATNGYSPDYAIFYPETKSLCFQPHPEWGHKGTEDYFFELLDKHVFPEDSEKESD